MHDRYFAVHGSGGRVLPVAAVLVGFAFVLTGSPTLAGPPPWAPAHGYRAQGGPPPWAPAHGYRAKKGKSKVVHVYQLPPGLQGGRCNHSLFDGPTAGGLLGAAAGGYAGSQFGRGDGKLAATALGTLVGFVLGQQVGSQLTYAEEVCFSRTFEHAPDQQTIVWDDARHGARYQVTPTQTVEASSGAYCREYQAQAIVGGKVENTYGTACRQPDGSWKLMN